jgi:septal ring factor EnvC (AmiA/AmiB activator)
MEKQLREERDARKALENEINKLKKKNDELIENLLKPN